MPDTIDKEPWNDFITEEFESEDYNLAEYSPRQLVEKFYWWLDERKLVKHNTPKRPWLSAGE